MRYWCAFGCCVFIAREYILGVRIKISSKHFIAIYVYYCFKDFFSIVNQVRYLKLLWRHKYLNAPKTAWPYNSMAAKSLYCSLKEHQRALDGPIDFSFDFPRICVRYVAPWISGSIFKCFAHYFDATKSGQSQFDGKRSTVLYLSILPELWPPVEFVWAAVNLQFSYKYVQ